MSVLDVLRRAIRFRWPTVLAVLLPAVVMGVGVVETRPDTVTAVGVVAVGPRSAEEVSGDAVRLALGRYAVSLTSEGVLERVAADTGIDAATLDDAVDITASQEGGNLSVRATLPREADAVAAVASIAKVAVAISDEDSLAGAAVLSEPRVEEPGLLASPRVLEAVVVLAALLVALGLAYALELLRPRVRTGGDAAAVVGAPVIGGLPDYAPSWPRRGAASDDDILVAARALRSGFSATAGSVPPGPVLVVGTETGAGASTVTFLLARSLSDRGESVLVLDLDLDQAGLSRRMGSTGQALLVDVLEERVPLLDATYHEGGVAVLPSEPVTGADDLVDRRLPDLLKQAVDHWDVVLCDTTPLDTGESSEIVAVHASSAVLVVRLGAPRSAVERAAARLTRLGLPVRGVVLNGATRDQANAPGLFRTGSEVG